MKKKISVILPCRNEEKNLPLLVPKIIENIPRKYSYEIICVDDGSQDKTSQEIAKLSKRNKNVKGIIFYKNFGHQTALLAGIINCRSDAIIMMDSDFQHPPDQISKMINKWEKGYDLVQMQKSSSRIHFNLGYKVWEFISAGTIVPGASDFRLVDKKIIEYIVSSQESEIFLRGLVKRAAANPIIISYKVGIRKYGKSSYTFKMFLNMFINGLISFSTLPLRVAWVTGILIALVAGFGLTLDIIISLINHQRIIRGYSTLVFLLLALNGFVIFYIGILGEYLGVVFKEIKKRPKYLIREKINI